MLGWIFRLWLFRKVWGLISGGNRGSGRRR